MSPWQAQWKAGGGGSGQKRVPGSEAACQAEGEISVTPRWPDITPANASID